MVDEIPLAPITETGSLGVCHLKRFWSSAVAARSGQPSDRAGEEDLDRLITDALGIGLHQALEYVYLDAPSFAEFEDWIVATAGRPEHHRVDRLNAQIRGDPQPDETRRWLESIESSRPALSPGELNSWAVHGYVTLRRAVPEDLCGEAESAIWKYLGADPHYPESWYRPRDHGIMVELIQHVALEANRRSARIHKAFSQLWGTTDLWVSADRCGFNPPQRDGYLFPGPDLHWDIDFRKPLDFGTQGILYLTDTPPEQGALTLVPGFQRRLASWLQQLDGRDPQQEDLHALGAIAVGGAVGDMVIWHHSLPHGSRPNLGTRPRIVQYINMYPGRRGG